MGRYIVRRLLWSGVVLIVTTLLAFLIFYVLPSTDPAVAFAGKQPTPELQAEVRKNLNLDKPVPVQYLTFLKNLVTGDEYGTPGFGKSYTTRQGIIGELGQRMVRTLQLAGGALVLWLIMGIAIGALSALRRRTFADRAAMGFALLGISTPVFFLALVSLYVFWFKLDVVPGTGYVGFREDPVGFFNQMIMPWTVLALLFAAVYARVFRGSMLEVMGEDYIRTARAKGLSEGRIVRRHMMRSAITPIVTLAGVDFAVLISSAVVTETVFNIPGVGAYALTGVTQQDLPVAMAVTVVTAVFVTLMSLVVDIVYAFLDPRVRYT